METAAEIEEFERNIEATLHQLMHALAAVQKRVNHTIEESQGENNMREAMLAYKRIKSRFWESLVQSISEDMEQFKANLRREFQAVEDDFRAHIQELHCARLAPVPLRDRIEREKWLVLGCCLSVSPWDASLFRSKHCGKPWPVFFIHDTTTQRRAVMQSGREPRVRPIRVATTREEFNACFASGEAFEASDELAAQFGFFPTAEDVVSDAEFFGPPDPNEPEAD